MNKTLKDIIVNISAESIIGVLDQPVNRVVLDSREADEGSVFVAIKGQKTDGHEFIEKAIESMGEDGNEGAPPPVSPPPGPGM